VEPGKIERPLASIFSLSTSGPKVVALVPPTAVRGEAPRTVEGPLGYLNDYARRDRDLAGRVRALPGGDVDAVAADPGHERGLRDDDPPDRTCRDTDGDAATGHEA
jgi:hypothetical protein